MINKLPYKKIFLYTLALVAPGGFLVLAGYQTYKIVKNKTKKETKEEENDDKQN